MKPRSQPQERNPQWRSDISTDDLVRGYLAGATLCDLEREFSLSRLSIRNRLTAAGVEIRSKTGAPGPRNGRWSGDNPSPNAGRLRAHKHFRDPQPCEECGSTDNPHRHHRDHNPGNNEASNIAWLCAGCHIRYHRRVERKRKQAA